MREIGRDDVIQKSMISLTDTDRAKKLAWDDRIFLLALNYKLYTDFVSMINSELSCFSLDFEHLSDSNV